MRLLDLLTRLEARDLCSLLPPGTLRLLEHAGTALEHDSLVKLAAQTLARGDLDAPSTRELLLDHFTREEGMTLLCAMGSWRADRPVEEQLRDIRWTPRHRDTISGLLGFRSPSVQGPNPSAGQEQDHVSVVRGLFPHQRHAARQVMDVLDGPHPKVVLHMPTGAGKTRTAMRVVTETLTRKPGPVVWLAAGEELCQQAVDEFSEVWSLVGDRNLPVHRHWGSQSAALEGVDEGLLVAGLAKLHQTVKRSTDGIAVLAPKTSLVVIDEAHQAAAPTYRNLLLDFEVLGRQGGLLGLTATPGRTWNDPEQDALLSEIFERRKITLSVPDYENPVEYLMDQGYLARPTFRSLTVASAEATRELATPTGKEYSRELLGSLADDDDRSVTILDCVRRLAQRHRRIIVFATTVEHSRTLAGSLQALGIWSRAVTGQTPSDERAATLNAYRDPAPEVRVLCNYGVLTTGFDAPQTSAAVIARPTKSLVLYSQMVGRATRGPRAGGNPTAEIVTVVDTALPGFGDLSDAFSNWEDVWD